MLSASLRGRCAFGQMILRPTARSRFLPAQADFHQDIRGDEINVILAGSRPDGCRIAHGSRPDDWIAIGSRLDGSWVTLAGSRLGRGSVRLSPDVGQTSVFARVFCAGTLFRRSAPRNECLSHHSSSMGGSSSVLGSSFNSSCLSVKVYCAAHTNTPA